MPLCPIIFVSLANLWLWKMFLSNIIIAIICFVASICLYFSSGKVSKVFIFLLAILLYLQWSTTEIQSLTKLDNDQQRVQQERLRQYPLVYLEISGKTILLPVAHWFEGRKESVALFRILNNLGETLEPNAYFFANHPRERIGIIEFEKFQYLFFPLFFIGLIMNIRQKNTNYFISFFAPLILLSFIGHKNNLGPFSLFPFLAASIAHGLLKYWVYLEKRNFLKVVSLALFIFIFLETLAYSLW